MKKIFLIVFILYFSISYGAYLDNIKVIGGNYGNIFKFIISGTANDDIINSSNNIIKILTGEEEKEALCSVKDTNSGEIGIYSCNLEEPISGKPFLKKEQDNNIFEISENIEIEPLEIELKYEEALNIEFNDDCWTFDLKGETELEIASQSLIYLDIKVDDSNQIAGCLFNSKNEKEYLFKCKVNMNEQNIYQKIIISKTKTANSSVTFSPQLTQDEHIIIFKSLNFVKGYNLLYNSNNWEFLVEISSQMLPIGSKSLIDITYNSMSSTATCISTSIYTLKCMPDKEEQSRFDLVNINNIKSEKSTITWNDLTAIYEIPIEDELEYSRLYDLTYIEKKWNFKILLKENRLPNNALVIADILYTRDENQNSARCYHSSSILSCIVNAQSQSASHLVQLSTLKKYGSISWKNKKSSDKIQFITTLTYKDSYDLDFIDDRWNFTLKADKSNTIPTNSLVAINIKYGEDKKTGIANCIKSSNDYLYTCEAIYENQNKNDLIIIVNTTEGISTSWKSTTAQEISITRLASLSLIEAYDLLYSNKKWSFKIKVEETLPEDSKLIIDITYNSNNNADAAICTYNNKILSCLKDDSSQGSTELIKLKKEKKYGSVKWLNIKDDYVKIPFLTTLSYSKSYGLFFTDVWNFIIEAISVDIAVPSGSYVIIDILQNSNEGRATCILDGGSKGKISNLTCSVIGANQLKNDVIKINPTKKYSTVTWNLLTTTNNNIPAAENKQLSLSFIDAYDMVYSNNTWLFTIIGKPTQTIWGGGIYVIDIIYYASSGYYDSTATCWTNGGTKADNILFKCKADINDQTENDLVKIKYAKTEKSSVTWTTGIKEDYQITLKTTLTLVKLYDLYFDQVWKFKINVDDGILPPGAKVRIDINRNKDLLTTNCTSLNNKCIICNTEISSNSYRVKLAEEKTKASSVEWRTNLQSDYLISLKTELALKDVNIIYFDENDNKWKFQITKNSGNLPEDSKIVVDILYDNSPSTATCYFISSQINCTVDKDTQEKNKLVKLSQTKTEQSTVTWTNLGEDKNFYLECGLTYEKAENLRYENSNWAFDVYISNEDIPKFSVVKVDIYAGTYHDIAKCTVGTKKLNCVTTVSTNTLIALYLTKTKSSTVTWTNLNPIDDRIDIIIKSTISYKSFGKIDLSNEKYTFTCEFSDSYIPNKGKVIIDILIGNTPHTSLCTGQGNYKLLCEIKNEDYTNPFIYISKTKTSDSTITWKNLESNKSITSIELGFYGAYNKKFEDGKFTFKILTYSNKLPNDIQVSVVVRYSETDVYLVDYEIPCISKNDILYCSIDIQNQKEKDNFQLYLPKDNSRDIKWLNGYNNYVDVTSDITLKFLRMNSFGYNNNNKYYYFSLYIQNVNEENMSGKYIIMDAKINDENTYAKCDLTINNGNTLLSCQTKVYTYNINNEISILASKNLGNVIWYNFVNDKLISDSYFGEISYMYDLKFEEQKWKFKIKLVKSETLEKQRTLDVYISGNRGIANCNLLNGVLSCEVDEENQTNSQVIRLSKEAFSGSLQLSNIEENRIPLKASLQFNKAYNLEFNSVKNNWSFMIEAKNNDNTVIIPLNSYFSMDIKYQLSTKVYNEIAYCSYNDAKEDNIISLLCTPKNKIAKNILIMINNVKSEFTSISWTNTLSDADLEMILSAELNVLEVNNLRFDTINNKWSFQLKLTEQYPINSNFIIDMKYNEENSTALCTFNSGYYLLCYPEVDNQDESDYFEISYNKIIGTVTYSNSPTNLIIKFFAKLSFVKAYDLKFNENQKWEFKIEVSDSNLKNGKTAVVDVKVGYTSSTALCKMDNNILYCEVLYYYQNEFDTIKLVNSYYNENVEWTNLNYEQDIYSKHIIKYIYSYGEFSDYKWKFNIKYELKSSNKMATSSKMLLDILVNDKESTAICEDYYFYTYLICEPTHTDQDEGDVIKIVGNETPNQGTIFWYEKLTNEQQIINKLKLSIEYSSISSYMGYSELTFYINGYRDKESQYEIIDNSKISIEVLINKTNGEIEKYNSICLTNGDIYAGLGSNVKLTCTIDPIYNLNQAYISIDSNGFSKDIEFTNKNENILIYPLYYYDIETDDEYGGGKGNNEKPRNDKDKNNSSKYLSIMGLFIIILFL